jgi:phosphoribosylpyrophosphate synthetase
VGPEDLPVLDLGPTDLFRAAFRDQDVKAEVVVSADRRGANRAARLAAALGVPHRVVGAARPVPDTS